MRVLHAAETIKGGVATVLRQLMISQQDNTEIESLDCLVPDEQRDEVSAVRAENVTTFHRTGRNIASFIRFFIGFSSLLLRKNPHIVHLHSTFAGVLGRIALIMLWPIRRPKVIYCPHAFSFLMQGSEKQQKAFSLVEKALTGITDAIICVSEHERDKAIEYGFPAHKLHVIYNGVPAVANENTMANPYPENVLNLLFVGRFDYQKGFDILITAMESLRGHPIHLTAVGGGVHNKYAPADTAPQTTYTGWLNAEALEPYFRHADVLIVPSRWEGFAMVPLEAMSYGLPVIASNCTSFPEMIEDRRTGLLFDLQQPEMLVRYLIDTPKEDWKRMGQEAKQLFLLKFTAETMIGTTAALYKKVLGA
ncbi:MULTISPECIES: glycosyltransferase [Serratia]|uniref:glycosyltransferase n=1 Tax=Serratia TaxID=613 RepID=UPI000744E467|nr:MULTISPECIES: glycosyltransferase [Serratia]APS35976.1 glycosyl transferase [Serratia marcescens]MBH2682083.1 glycosyltransferase [Serratia marcescens]MBH2706241.1 glycosyltransferase [Serratia marcescens]MBH2729893.1 glycosyltransferase [Serratia marcescens]MBH2867338.1 glycosyltransferase [Serratia marcescens]